MTLFIANNLCSFGFAKYINVRDSELCIRGFYKLGYEVGFARVFLPLYRKLRRR
jgi:hypothetical protein